MSSLEKQSLSCPSVVSYRYLILLMTCMNAIGAYFCLDIPAVLKEQIIDHLMAHHSYSRAELYYSLLYTVYNMPNMVLPLLGGFFTDKFGDRSMTIIFTLFVTLGQAIIVLGTHLDSFQTIILGRFVFGIGGESLNITLSTISIRWFQGDELSLSQSIFLSAARGCSIMNAFVTPQLSMNYGILQAQYFGFLLCVFSMFCSFLLVVLDKRFQGEESENSETISISQMIQNTQNLSKLYWLLTLVTLCLYICVVTLTSFLSGIIVHDWLPSTNSIEHNQEIAAKLMSILFIISTVFLPIIGITVDKIGYRIRLLQLSCLLMVVAFCMMLFRQLLIPLMLIGVGYALFGAIVWPVVAYLVPKNQLGSGMGILTCIQNTGLALAPLLVTYVKSVYGSNQAVIGLFLVVALVGFYFTIKMQKMDRLREVSLDSSDQTAIINCLQKEQYVLANSNKEYQKHSDEEGDNIGKIHT